MRTSINEGTSRRRSSLEYNRDFKILTTDYQYMLNVILSEEKSVNCYRKLYPNAFILISFAKVLLLKSYKGCLKLKTVD